MTTDTGALGGTGTPLSTEERHIESLRHTQAKLDAQIRAMIETDKLGHTVEEITKNVIGMRDPSRGTPGLHPKFRDVLVEKVQKVLLDQVTQKIDAKMQRLMRAEAKTRVDKYLNDECDYVISNYTGESLHASGRELAQSMQEIQDDLPVRIEQIDKLLEVIDNFEKLEFIQGLLAAKALTYVSGERALKNLRERFQKFSQAMSQNVADLQQKARSGEASTTAMQAVRDEELGIVMKKSYEILCEYFPSRESLASSMTDAYSSMTLKVTDSMVDAYIHSNSHAVANLDGVKEVVENGLKVTEPFLKTTNYTGFFMRLGEFVNNVANKSAKEAIIAVEVAKFKEEELTVTLFGEFNLHPDMFYKRLQESQQAALEIFISGLGLTISGGLLAAPPGVAEPVMKAFDILTGVVQDVIKEILDARDKGAQAQIKAARASGELPSLPSGPEDKAIWEVIDGLWDRAYDGIKEEVESKLQKKIDEKSNDIAKSVASKIAGMNVDTAVDIIGFVYDPETGGIPEFNPLQIEAMVTRILVPPVTRFVLQHCKVKPAEIISGKQLTTMLDNIFLTQLPLGSILRQSVIATAQTPAQVDRSAHAVPDDIKGHRVIDTNDTKSRFPDDPDEVSVYLALELDGIKVWGRWNPASRKWVARAIDDGAFVADWTQIAINKDAITENGTEVKGQWYGIVSEEKACTHVGFKGADNKWRLAHLADRPSGPHGTQFSLGEQTARRRVTVAIGDIFLP